MVYDLNRCRAANIPSLVAIADELLSRRGETYPGYSVEAVGRADDRAQLAARACPRWASWRLRRVGEPACGAGDWNSTHRLLPQIGEFTSIGRFRGSGRIAGEG